jgi:hypothetical protein
MILERMDLLRVEAALLRAQLPELVLRPGMTLPARVMERAGRFGVLLLAGTPLSAELPGELKAGDRLRLRVEEVSADRVVLRAVGTPAPAPAPTPPTTDWPASPVDGGAQLALPLPGGRHAEVRVTEQAAERRSEGEPASVALSYDSPALGTLDLRLVQQPGGAGLQVTVGATAGVPEERARGAAEELRRALTEATGLPAAVRVVGRPPRSRLSVYA